MRSRTAIAAAVLTVSAACGGGGSGGTSLADSAASSSPSTAVEGTGTTTASTAQRAPGIAPAAPAQRTPSMGTPPPPPPPRPGYSTEIPPRPSALAGAKEFEELSWERLSAWWPYRPLLHAGTRPTGTNERTFAWSHGAGGSRGNPREDRAGIVVVYELHTATADTAGMMDVVFAGGYVLDHLSPAEAAQWTGPATATRDTVAGRAVSQWTIPFDTGKTTRVTRWSEQGAEMMLLTGEERHSPDDVRRFLESVRPRSS